MSNELKWCSLPEKPRVVCLCGSTRFMDEFFRSGWNETLAGRIVLSVGVVMPDQMPAAQLPIDEGHVGEALGIKDMLDELHFRKIDLADEILVLNVDGYIGASTQREIAYAMATNKPVRFLDHEAGDRTLEDRAHAIGKQVAAFMRGDIPPAPPAPARSGEGEA